MKFSFLIAAALSLACSFLQAQNSYLDSYIREGLDSNRGLNSAVAAGIDCVIVYNDFTKTHDFSHASYRIKTLIELKDIILNAT